MCVRLADAGYRIMTIGGARVVHLLGKTTGRKSPYIIYYMTRNRLICLFRHNRPAAVLKRSPYLARTFSWELRDNGLDWERQLAFAKGVLDFALRRRGEDPRAITMRRQDQDGE
jgi:GT2 family glycosyltransferase